MKKVISRLFSFVKQLFLRLRLVITLSIGKDTENEEEQRHGSKEDRSGKD